MAPASGGICWDATSVRVAAVKANATAEVTARAWGQRDGNVLFGPAAGSGPAQSPERLPQVHKLDRLGNFASR